MFLKLEYEMMRCTGFSLQEKLLLSYFYSLKLSDRAFWGSTTYLAALFGADTIKIEKILDKMVEKELIIRASEGFILNKTWSELMRIGQKLDEE